MPEICYSTSQSEKRKYVSFRSETIGKLKISKISVFVNEFSLQAFYFEHKFYTLTKYSYNKLKTY